VGSASCLIFQVFGDFPEEWAIVLAATIGRCHAGSLLEWVMDSKISCAGRLLKTLIAIEHLVEPL
jgi:hypothetical protein